eukprot:comp20020_c0_seq2/m.39193 comp20020_c0_seq2/g.39193  ORF comp20020_c0_seq2/g.39193 comp20020_c0_seq2/m.39193 type:complete len:338 (+) comp20020_c0_seq2:213-1226(+)
MEAGRACADEEINNRGELKSSADCAVLGLFPSQGGTPGVLHVDLEEARTRPPCVFVLDQHLALACAHFGNHFRANLRTLPLHIRIRIALLRIALLRRLRRHRVRLARLLLMRLLLWRPHCARHGLLLLMLLLVLACLLEPDRAQLNLIRKLRRHLRGVHGSECNHRARQRVCKGHIERVRDPGRVRIRQRGRQIKRMHQWLAAQNHICFVGEFAEAGLVGKILIGLAQLSTHRLNLGRQHNHLCIANLAHLLNKLVLAPVNQRTQLREFFHNSLVRTRKLLMHHRQQRLKRLLGPRIHVALECGKLCNAIHALAAHLGRIAQRNALMIVVGANKQTV